MKRNLSACIALLLVCALWSGCKSSSENAEPTATTSSAASEARAENGRVSVTVDGEGYHPSKIHAKRGQPLTMIFTRTTDLTCGQELVFPAENLRRELPLNQPVAVNITPQTDTVRFTCGMNMYEGVVQTN